VTSVGLGVVVKYCRHCELSEYLGRSEVPWFETLQGFLKIGCCREVLGSAEYLQSPKDLQANHGNKGLQPTVDLIYSCDLWI
jgi:hypothetical protein